MAARWASALVLLACGATGVFQPGNIIVLRAGSSGSPYAAGVSALATLVEFDPSGTVVSQLVLPTTTSGAQNAVSLSADDALAGALSSSDDRRFLLFGAFATPPGSATPDATNANLTNRVVVKVGFDGVVDTSLTVNKFSGDGKAARGGIRCVASDNGVDIFVGGYDDTRGSGVYVINGTGRMAGTVQIADVNLASCVVADNRLLAVNTSGVVVAIEDLHSIEPGLPDALFDPAFVPTVRTLSDGTHDRAGGTSMAFVGRGGGSKLFLSSTSATCLSEWTFVDSTPSDYVEDVGYLDAGMDILAAPGSSPLTLADAKRLCTASAMCAGFTFTYNASIGPNPPDGRGPRPYDPSMSIWTFLKGPFFYYTQTGTEADWFTFQKPTTSGNFKFSWKASASSACSPLGQGLFAVAADDSSPAILYATSADGKSLLRFDTSTRAARVLATAPSGTIFRGVATAPGGAPTPANNGGGSGSGPGSVAAGVLVPLLLVGAVSGYLFVYQRGPTSAFLQEVGRATRRAAGVRAGSGTTAERISLLAGATVPPGLPGPGAMTMPAAALVPSPEHVKARTRTLSAVAIKGTHES